MIIKSILIFFVLCLAQDCLGKPVAEGKYKQCVYILSFISGYLTQLTSLTGDITNGPGVLSTIWGWLTYPYTWLASEKPPIHEPFIASTSKYETPENIKIFTHNVTVWCNNQTCTTQKCQEFGCRNITCNIYDTDLMGECREYNIISTPEETVPNLTEPAPKPPLDATAQNTSALEVISTTVATTDSSTQNNGPTPTAKVKPQLQLEGFLSATVDSEKKGSDSKKDPIIDFQEVSA